MRKSYTNKEKRITIRIWKSTHTINGDFGHVSLQTYAGKSSNPNQGHYVSYWPTANTALASIIKGTSVFQPTCLETDMLLETESPGKFALDVEAVSDIQQAQEKITAWKSESHQDKIFVSKLIWIKNENKWYFAGRKVELNLIVNEGYVIENNSLKKLHRSLLDVSDPEQIIIDGNHPKYYALLGMIIVEHGYGKKPDYEINLYSLDINAINHAYEAFLQNPQTGWALLINNRLLRIFFKSNNTNCSGLSWYLLQKGNIKQLFKNDFFPIDGVFGSVMGAKASLGNAVFSALGSAVVSIFSDTVKFRLFPKWQFLSGLFSSVEKNIYEYFGSRIGDKIIDVLEFTKSSFLRGAIVGGSIGIGMICSMHILNRVARNISFTEHGADTNNPPEISWKESFQEIIETTGNKNFIKIIATSTLLSGTLSSLISTLSNLVSAPSIIKPISNNMFTSFLIPTIIGAGLGFFVVRTNMDSSLNNKASAERDFLSVAVIRSSIIMGIGLSQTHSSVFWQSSLIKGLFAAGGVLTAAALLGALTAFAVTPNDLARLAIRAKKAEMKQYEYQPYDPTAQHIDYVEPPTFRII